MIEALQQNPVDEFDDGLSIEGDVFTEQDLVEDTSDFMELATPDGVDQGWLLEALWRDLRRGEHAQAVLAEAEMARVIELNQRLGPAVMQEGAGQLMARIPMSVFLHWTTRYGEAFWREKDSLDFILKRAGGGQGNPGFKVESMKKAAIIVDGYRGTAALTNSSGVGEVAGGGRCAGVKPAAAGANKPAAAVPPSAPKRGPVGRRGRWAT